VTDSTVVIDRLAFGGNGVCRIDGKVCFVPFSCPGDEVRLTVTSEKKSFLSARIAELVSPSPYRVSPPCPHFGRCGGCFWQHIDYSHQLAAKQTILAEALWRGARVEAVGVLPVLPSAQQYGYRSRVQFKVQSQVGRLKIGFYRSGSHAVEDLPQGCLISKPQINQALHSLRSVLAAYRENGSITGISLDCTEQQVVAVITGASMDKRTADRFFQEQRSRLLPLTALHLRTSPSGSLRKIFGDDELEYAVPSPVQGTKPCHLSYLPGGFSQVNREQNIALLDLVTRLGMFQSDQQILDLYCGNGNLSLPLAGRVSAITGVEDSKLSIESARRNMQRNGIDTAAFICDDSIVAARRCADSGHRYDTVILDPPRAGAAGVIPEICRLNPAKVIYVSCDPSTLARDCGLLARSGYEVKESVPIDMFPQTYHIESVTLLLRR
jgi:23S rRNA (uracil1939-C5)-methyltransferase